MSERGYEAVKKQGVVPAHTFQTCKIKKQSILTGF